MSKPEEIIVFIVLFVYFIFDSFMKFWEFRPVERAFEMMSCMISEISSEEIVPWSKDIV